MASTIKVDNVQNQPGTNIINKCGTTITLGASSDTINLASGATQTGFGRTGTVDWQTGDIKTGAFTGASGKGYFVNTTGGAITVNLPAGSAGDIVGLKDYAGTWQTNAITLNANGTDKIGGFNSADPLVENEGGSLLLVYVDGTQGWLTTAESITTSPSGEETFVAATVTGACNTLATAPCCADVKIATFTGPGTFCVSSVASSPASNVVSYVVIAGGGGGGTSGGGAGGGGAGGYREVKSPSTTGYTASPLDGYATPANRITVTQTAFPITVGAGGATNGLCGTNSVFSIISSAGGGGGGGSPISAYGKAGGSGGGGNGMISPGGDAGAGNTPPVSPPQGSTGGIGASGSGGYQESGGGGGGAGAVGAVGTGNAAGGNGGIGIATSITAASVTRVGGGGGGWGGNGASTYSLGGTGGGGNGGNCRSAINATVGTVLTGSGGGGGAGPGGTTGGTGGSGIVIIRYKFQ